MPDTDLQKRLSFPREKPKSIVISLAYRVTALVKKIAGRERLLRWQLNASWLFWRFAFELAGEIYGAKFHNRAKALNEKFLRKWIPENGSVIDIGCGIGRWCDVASKCAKTVVGIDFDPGLIAQAKGEVNATNVRFVVGDVTKDLQGETFDLALLIHVIEHIDDADKMFKDLKNVAGTLIVEVPDFEHDPLNWVRLETGSSFYTDGDHVREYTESILIDQLTQNGWQVLETRKNGGAVLAVAAIRQQQLPKTSA